MTIPQDQSWLEKPSVYHKCPKCPSGYLTSRVPRGAVVKFLGLNLRRYKCNSCEAKVYLKIPTSQEEAVK